MNRILSSLQRNIPTVITVTHFFASNNCFFSKHPLNMYRYNTHPIQDDSQVTNKTLSIWIQLLHLPCVLAKGCYLSESLKQ